MNGRQDETGILLNKTSLTYLMSNCQDFEEEESLLQTMGREMGIIVDCTPKCHCELAGEGIEYTWGFAKNHYRTMRLQSKKGKENFKEAVKKCISRDLLTTENRQQQQQHQTYQVDESTTPEKLEKLVKEFKTHCCAFNFDSSFCKVIFTEGEST